MSENESEEEIKSDVEMKEEKEIMLKDTSLLDQLSTTKYNYDTNENTVDSRKNLRYSLEGISCDLTKRFATELTKFYTVLQIPSFI